MERKVTIEEEALYQEDYQMHMLQENHIGGFLTVKGRGADGKSYYDYDVSGMTSMKAVYEKSELTGEDICSFLESLLYVIEEAKKYLLNIHRIVIKPEYIYQESGKYYFCYYPPGKDNLWEAFHRLTEYFVKRADYKDQNCVQMIFLLHKETMEENYSLEKIAVQCLCQKPEKEEVSYPSEHEIEASDWIAEQELGYGDVKNSEDTWTPVKRFFRRHRRSKWGDWDGLYIEEEEF